MRNVFWVAEWCAQDFETSLHKRCIFSISPQARPLRNILALLSKKSKASGRVPARFQTLIFPACAWIRTHAPIPQCHVDHRMRTIGATARVLSFVAALGQGTSDLRCEGALVTSHADAVDDSLPSGGHAENEGTVLRVFGELQSSCCLDEDNSQLNHQFVN